MMSLQEQEPIAQWLESEKQCKMRARRPHNDSKAIVKDGQGGGGNLFVSQKRQHKAKKI